MATARGEGVIAGAAVDRYLCRRCLGAAGPCADDVVAAVAVDLLGPVEGIRRAGERLHSRLVTIPQDRLHHCPEELLVVI